MFLCTLATKWAKISSIYSKITNVGVCLMIFQTQNHTLCLRIFLKKSDLLERHIPVCLTTASTPPPPPPRAIFGPTCMYKKLRNFRTVPPRVTNLVSKCAGNLKEKSHKVSRRELCALQSNRTKCRRGGGLKVFLGLRKVH